MGLLTVADVLAMPAVRAARPEVVAGHGGLNRQVRWVHSTELADIAPLLREGDLVLSTGIAMPDTAPELADFAESLAEMRCAGLVIELGRRWSEVPPPLIAASDRLALPLVALRSEVPFAAVAQAVGERIVDEQLQELREAEHVHDTFTELSISEAGPEDILLAVQRLAGAHVVLENEQHQVVDYRSGPGDISDFLARWTARSRRVRLDGRTGWDEDNGWLVTRVGKRDRGWGRLVVQAPDSPTQRQVAMAERAAAALAAHRLHDRQRDSVIRRTHHELLLGLLADPTSADLLRRCEMAGLPTAKRTFVGLTLRPRLESMPASTRATQSDEVLAATVHATHELRVPALVCEVERDVRVLLSLAASANSVKVVDDLAARVRRRRPAVVASGRPAAGPADIDRTLREAQQVMQSVHSDTPERDVHRLEDVHLRGLIAMLVEDERLQLFVDRELDVLRRHDEKWGSDLLAAVAALVHHPNSKSDAATSLHISRPVFYDRLAKAGRVLGVDLDDPDIRVSLHVALMAMEVQRQGMYTLPATQCRA
jgi:purine catabolism regulator